MSISQMCGLIGLLVWGLSICTMAYTVDAEPKLEPCPDSPNCVSSQAADERWRVEPLHFAGDPAAAWSRLRDVVSAMKRSKVISAESPYLHAEFRTSVFRFVDDVEFILDPEHQRIDVRSASRVGYSDFGLNRRRVEAIRMAFSAASRPRQTADLSTYQWQYRLLLLFASDKSGRVAPAALEDDLLQRAQGVTERRLLVFRYPGESALRAALDVPADESQAVLIGLDGGIKLRLTDPESLSPIFAAIDAMPLRQAEMNAGGADR